MSDPEKKESVTDSWLVEEADEATYNCSQEKGVWQPKADVILSMFKKLSEGGTLPLNWTCPGRRLPEVVVKEENDGEEGMELDEDDIKEEVTSVPEPSAFDFDETPSDVGTKLTPRRTPGGNVRTPRTEKRVARMDNIMDSLRREQLQRAAEREARRAKGSPAAGRGRLLNFNSPGPKVAIGNTPATTTATVSSAGPTVSTSHTLANNATMTTTSSSPINAASSSSISVLTPSSDSGAALSTSTSSTVDSSAATTAAATTAVDNTSVTFASSTAVSVSSVLSKDGDLPLLSGPEKSEAMDTSVASSTAEESTAATPSLPVQSTVFPSVRDPVSTTVVTTVSVNIDTSSVTVSNSDQVSIAAVTSASSTTSTSQLDNGSTTNLSASSLSTKPGQTSETLSTSSVGQLTPSVSAPAQASQPSSVLESSTMARNPSPVTSTPHVINNPTTTTAPSSSTLSKIPSPGNSAPSPVSTSAQNTSVNSTSAASGVTSSVTETTSSIELHAQPLTATTTTSMVVTSESTSDGSVANVAVNLEELTQDPADVALTAPAAVDAERPLVDNVSDIPLPAGAPPPSSGS
ncbi:uncharacterized protein DDB_G0271670 [Aplysia californica]|uniref:Uncharacterized protein DDB_G0271670 n=1 Tax=Aplysia californica TaxID=6500 RepID=A0ABM0K3Z7_APLCA|nr:uncharacterized protein DDB_G0271670 [Aplysia californica]